MYFIYIIYSNARSKYYVGSCQSVTERIKKHNTNHSGFIGKTGDWELKYTEECSDKSAALKLEKQIKNWKSRKMIEQLIASK
ncbi:GIY-YIG nuclease family protein [Mucilaginibacter sp. dw_454]|uniref:GIY-YIG nuclease family protein n=1 Tax=Mucilaginibacter sp. dw_454 TaxID=2720079 RepID=UPI001BD4EC2B|nr:GIY-YIG nuclease family protein [Mucilaginibacter sp. dw_454]